MTFSVEHGRSWDNPSPIQRDACNLCGGPRDLEHQRSWRHQVAQQRYDDTLVLIDPETKWAEAKEAGWVSNYQPYDWQQRGWRR